MTTEVVVKASHGWDVKVSKIHHQDGVDTSVEEHIVSANTERSFHIYQGVDIRVNEMKPVSKVNNE